MTFDFFILALSFGESHDKVVFKKKQSIKHKEWTMCSHRENKKIIIPVLTGDISRAKDNSVICLVFFLCSFSILNNLMTFFHYLNNVSYYYIKQTVSSLYKETPLNRQEGKRFTQNVVRNSVPNKAQGSHRTWPYPYSRQGQGRTWFLEEKWVNQEHMELPTL